MDKLIFQKPPLKRLLEWQTLIAALLNAVVVAIVAIFVTSAVTNSQKRTEFFVDFTKKYQTVLAEAHELNNRIKKKRQADRTYQPDDIDIGDAHQIYFQLFGLVYDEYAAYKKSFLDQDTIIDWMTWQMKLFNYNTFEIGGVRYTEGWVEWLKGAQDHSITPVVTRIFACQDRACVARIIRIANA